MTIIHIEDTSLEKSSMRFPVMMQSIILFLLFCSVMETRAFTCDPWEDCLQSVVGGLVPDPKNCEYYFMCLDRGSGLIPSDEPIPCPSGEYFNQTSKSCQPETVPGICNENLCPQLCKSTCWYRTDVIYNAGDCSKYFICGNNTTPTEVTCPGDKPYFNGAVCVTDSANCCDPCEVYCYEPGSEIVDPRDCTKFYVCQEIGPINEQYHLSCDSGDFFDPKLGKCVTGTDCIPFCGKTTTPKPTTTFNYTTTEVTTTTMENSTPSIPPSCTDTYICIIDGDYPRCSFCDNSYIHCENKEATLVYCPAGLYFNTNRCYPGCVQDCPWP